MFNFTLRSRSLSSLPCSAFVGALAVCSRLVCLAAGCSSLLVSRSIGVELDSEGSIVSTCIDREFEEHVCKVEMLSFPFVKLKFSVYGRKQTYIHTCLAMQSR